MKLKGWDYSGTLSKNVSAREVRHREIARKVAAEGMVLLENDGILPLAKGSKIAVYGGGASYTVKGGTGSGAVNNRENVSIAQGLRDAGFRLTNEAWLSDYDQRYEKAREEWIQYIYEISEPNDFTSLYRAHASNPLVMPGGAGIHPTDTDTAIYLISRVSGEGADRKLEKGDYYLSQAEEEELSAVQTYYRNVIVVLNVGGVIDTSFTDRYHVSALILMSQAGMEGGHALADCILGTVNPSGKLSDTWAVDYHDYPSSETFSHNNGNIYEEKYTEGIYVGYRYFDSFGVAPRYPFGYGLSYTDFRVEPLSAELQPGFLHANVKVTNTGKCPGKETVFFFASCPQGMLTKENKRLIGFEKTGLLQPGESCEVHTAVDLYLLESYHTGQSAYYMEAGEYYVLAGTSAADYVPLVSLKLEKTRKMQQLKEICPLLDALREISPSKETQAHWRSAYARLFSKGIPALQLDEFLQERKDVYSESCLQKRQVMYSDDSLSDQELYEAPGSEKDQIRIQARKIRERLSLEQKASLCCGRQNGSGGEFIGNSSSQVPGAAGETTTILEKDYQMGSIVMADGPAGLRLQQCYRVNPENGELYRMNPYQALENRIFGKDFEWEGAVKYYQFCTAIPVGTLLAQTFDLNLIREVGEMIGREMQEFHLTLWLAPGMNIHRNPLCGRNFEYYSEDPLVSGRMAAAMTDGVQKIRGLGTTIKHFACNNQEENRRGVNSIVSERALREIYLKGYEIAVRESQPLAIMTSYNKINGVHSANNKDLCTRVARTEWGFRGIIMTDWTTTNDDGGASAAKCISAGNDLVMPGNQNDIREIIDAVNLTGSQKLDIKDLDDCCDRILNIILNSRQ